MIGGPLAFSIASEEITPTTRVSQSCLA